MAALLSMATEKSAAENSVKCWTSAGNGPTTSTSATVASSLNCYTAISAAPVSSASPVKPFSMIVARALIASAMPSRSIRAAK
jgi:hypothetical protein